MGKKSLRERATKIKLTQQAKGGFVDSKGKHYTQKEGVALLLEDKAKLNEWHGGKKKQRGTPGRKEGTKNLVKLNDGSLMNESGVKFTPEEKKAFEKFVERNNRKRRHMIDEEKKLPRLSGGKETGDTIGSLHLMGSESDFILSRKRKSLQQFKTRESFEKAMKNLEYVLSKDYINDRIELYKANHIKALENVFGDDAEDVIEKIKAMNNKTYKRKLQQDEFLEVAYIYDPSQRTGKLNQIRASLGMNLKEVEYLEPFDE